MKRKLHRSTRHTTTKSVLRLPDLRHAKAAVLNGLTSQDAQEAIGTPSTISLSGLVWSPGSLNRIVVLRYSSHLESRHPAPATINLRLGAVPCLRGGRLRSAQCRSADGVRRIRGVKKLGVCLGNWLTAEQGQRIWQAPDKHKLKGKRDRAVLLLACGLRRHEAVTLTLDHLQQREDHWAIVDLVGKAGHVRTVPVPGWVKCELQEWLNAPAIDRGKLFRRVNKAGKTWGDGRRKDRCGTSSWSLPRPSVSINWRLTIFRRTCARLCHASGGELATGAARNVIFAPKSS